MPAQRITRHLVHWLVSHDQTRSMGSHPATHGAIPTLTELLQLAPRWGYGGEPLLGYRAALHAPWPALH